MKHGLFHIIRRPIVSEKSTALAEVGGRYVFQVNSKASKPEIKDAIQKLFQVHVKKVRTLNVPGKTKTIGRHLIKRTTWKKAIITLRAGEKIDVFESPQATT